MAVIAGLLLALSLGAPRLDAARDTAAQLAALRAPAEDEEALELSIPTERLLHQLQRQLAEWAVARLGARPAPDGAGLHAELRAAGLGGGGFGSVSRVDVARAGKGLSTLAITLDLGFVEDTALHVLADGRRGPTPVLEWSAEVADLLAPARPWLARDLRKGLNRLEWRLVEDEGGFFVFAAWGQPGHPSNWGAVSWAVLRPGPRAAAPAVLASGSDGAFQCDENCFDIGQDGRRPWIDYVGPPGSLAIASGLTTRGARRSFVVGPAGAEEVVPPAGEARGILDAWIDAPWDVARLWTADPALQARHRELAALVEEGSLEFGSFWDEPCEAPSIEVVELVPVAAPGPAIRVVVDGQGRIASVSGPGPRAAAPVCPGPP